MIIESLLDVNERIAFIKFLRHERLRHEQDIIKINLDIERLGSVK